MFGFKVCKSANMTLEFFSSKKKIKIFLPKSKNTEFYADFKYVNKVKKYTKKVISKTNLTNMSF